MERHVLSLEAPKVLDIGCRTGNGIVQCSPVQPIQLIFHFLCVILCPHIVERCEKDSTGSWSSIYLVCTQSQCLSGRTCSGAILGWRQQKTAATDISYLSSSLSPSLSLSLSLQLSCNASDSKLINRLRESVFSREI